MKEPIDIRTKQPVVVEAEETPLTPAQRQPRLTASRLDAKFVETQKRIHRDLAEFEPQILASALSSDSREAARELVMEVRAWLDAFEQELRRGGDLRAI